MPSLGFIERVISSNSGSGASIRPFSKPRVLHHNDVDVFRDDCRGNHRQLRICSFGVPVDDLDGTSIPSTIVPNGSRSVRSSRISRIIATASLLAFFSSTESKGFSCSI